MLAFASAAMRDSTSSSFARTTEASISHKCRSSSGFFNVCVQPSLRELRSGLDVCLTGSWGGGISGGYAVAFVLVFCRGTVCWPTFSCDINGSPILQCPILGRKITTWSFQEIFILFVIIWKTITWSFQVVIIWKIITWSFQEILSYSLFIWKIITWSFQEILILFFIRFFSF